jgi:hypothetical protein
MYVALLLFVWPAGRLDIAQLKYDPPVQFNTVITPEPEQTFTSALAVQTHGSSGFNVADQSLDVRMPIVPRLAMMFGHGLNRAATKALPDSTSMRLLDQGLANLKIPDPNLKAELVAFHQQCYIPAVNKYQSFWREQGKPAALVVREERFGIQDTTWMGSAVLLETEGLYKPCLNPGVCGSSLQSSTPVQGFAYNTARDGEALAYTTPGAWGRPYCSEWWTQSLEPKVWAMVDGPETMPKFQKVLALNAINWLGNST